jgi:hypothetical protein
MKTAQKLQVEVANLSAKKRVDFLRVCMYYVQSNPKQEFLESEKDRLNNRINMFMQNYEPLDAERFSKKQCTAHKKKFEKEMDIPKLKQQLLTINFILN